MKTLLNWPRYRFSGWSLPAAAGHGPAGLDGQDREPEVGRD